MTRPSDRPNPASAPIPPRASRAYRPACPAETASIPVLVVNGPFSAACTNGSGSGFAPPSASMIGRTNNWNVTIVDTGFPGSPKNGFVLPSNMTWPNTTGLPGCIAAPVKKNSAPSEASTSSTRSYFPMDTPPVSSSKSASSPLRSRMRQLARFVACYRQDHRFAAGLVNLRRQRIAVGIANLVRPWRQVDVNQLVSRGQHRHARSADARQPQNVPPPLPQLPQHVAPECRARPSRRRDAPRRPRGQRSRPPSPGASPLRSSPQTRCTPPSPPRLFRQVRERRS